MRKLTFVEGDATDPAGGGPRIIAHVCNDIGAWGKGIVQAVSRRWPAPEREFRRWHRESVAAGESPGRRAVGDSVLSAGGSPGRPGPGDSVLSAGGSPGRPVAGDSVPSAFRLGAMQLIPVEPDLWVANMIGQHGIRTRRGLRTGSGYEPGAGPPVRYEAIHECLTTLVVHARAHDASVHMPRIGCGLAGGVWSEVEPLIVGTLCAAGIPTVVYDLPSR